MTEPTEEFIQNIQDWGLDTACENYRLGGEPDSGSIGPSGSGNEPGTDGDESPDSGSIGPSGSGNEPGTDGDESPKKRPSSTRKYLCPVCGNSVRATKEYRTEWIGQ